MTQTSLPWSGTTLGDATIAAYDHLEFSRMFNKLLASDGAGYVVPGYANNLNVQASAPAAATIDVLTGAALVKGFLYESDAAETLAIAANASGNPRLDRIILRVDFANQTVRLAILQGTPAAVPALPALTQTYGVTWEISLAYVWVANGFATITEVDIHEERVFLTTFSNPVRGPQENMIVNSEFIFANTLVDGSGLFAGPWSTIGGSASSIAYVARSSLQQRGYACQVTGPVGSPPSAWQLINVKPGEVYTYRGLIRSTSTGARIRFWDVTNAAQITERYIRPVNSDADETVYFTAPAGCKLVLVWFYHTTNNAVIVLGQQLVVPGYYKPAYLTKHEHISHIRPIADATWNFTAKSTSTPTVDLTAVAWGTLQIFESGDIYSIDLVLGANDSASAGAATGACELLAGGGTVTADYPAKLNLAGFTNDRRVFQNAAGVRLQRSDNTTLVSQRELLGFNVVATGAGTLDAYVGILGIET